VTRLTDEELDAYAYHARAQADEPLASLVAELQARRHTARQTGRLATVCHRGPGVGTKLACCRHCCRLAAADRVLVIAPEGTQLPDVSNGAQGWALETYDPSQPLELRQVLQTYGIGL